MRTFTVQLHDKERNRYVAYTAEYFEYEHGVLRVYHRTLGNICVGVSSSEVLIITQDREEEE